jgi:GRASP55/65 PDZ-like domain
MGNAATTPQDGDEFAAFDGVETLGYRVLGVQPDSPASKAGLVSFFDFLLGANQQMLLGSGEGLEEGDEYDDVDFPALLQANKGKTVELLVWNIKVGLSVN